MMASVTFDRDPRRDLSSAIHTGSNTLVEGVYLNEPLQYDVYKPVNISHPSRFVSFASYFCGSAGFSEFILIKMPGTLIFIVTLQNLMYFLTDCYVLVS